MAGDNDLRPEDRESFRTAVELLAPLGLPLVGAVEEYVECRRKLGTFPLLAAVEEFAARARGFEPSRSLSEVLRPNA